MPFHFLTLILQLPYEIEKLSGLGGLKRSEHVLQLSRLMVRAEVIEQRTELTDVLLVGAGVENSLR